MPESFARDAPDLRPSESATKTFLPSLQFSLDICKLSRGQGDLLDPLILTAILDANQAVFRQEPSLLRTYGHAGAALPDELRRPISINAVAKSLRLPFESVRRRVQGWLRAGVCVQAESGVYVPVAVVTSPPYLAVQAARVQRLARFEEELIEAGLLIAPENALPWGEVVRSADRLIGEYMLRVADQMIELTGGPMQGFVLLGLGGANLHTVSEADLVRASPHLPAAAAAAPVSAVCAQLGMPSETVRRRLHSLRHLGFAERRAGRWLCAAPPGSKPRMVEMVTSNEGNVRRLFARLAEVRAPLLR